MDAPKAPAAAAPGNHHLHFDVFVLIIAFWRWNEPRLGLGFGLE